MSELTKSVGIETVGGRAQIPDKEAAVQLQETLSKDAWVLPEQCRLHTRFCHASLRNVLCRVLIMDSRCVLYRALIVVDNGGILQDLWIVVHNGDVTSLSGVRSSRQGHLRADRWVSLIVHMATGDLYMHNPSLNKIANPAHSPGNSSVLVKHPVSWLADQVIV